MHTEKREKEKEKEREEKGMQKKRRCSRAVALIVVGNGFGDPSSNPGLGCLHFT